MQLNNVLARMRTLMTQSTNQLFNKNESINKLIQL